MPQGGVPLRVSCNDAEHRQLRSRTWRFDVCFAPQNNMLDAETACGQKTVKVTGQGPFDPIFDFYR